MANDSKAPNFLGENTILKLTIAKADHQKAYKEVLESYRSRMTLPGFRKGKAPANLVESRVGHDELVQAVVERLAPKLYAEAVEKQKLEPMTPPQVRIVEHPADADWQLEAHTAVPPVVSLGDWKKVVKDAGRDAVKTVKPVETHTHADGTVHTAEESKETNHLTFVFQQLINATNPKVAPILIEYEAQQRLQSFVQDLKRHNLELSEYLAHNSLTPEKFEEEIISTALASRQLESVLLEITSDLKVEATKEEIAEFLGDTSKFSDKAIERLSTDAKAIIIRRKVIDEIKKLAGIKEEKS